MNKKLKNNLTDHGDHLTTGEQTRAGWLSIIVQPLQGLNQETVYYANSWRHGVFCVSSSYCTTAEEAVLEVLQIAESLPAKWCDGCGCDLDEFVDKCIDCIQWEKTYGK